MHSVVTSPSGYLRFRDADGGVSGVTAGNRISSFTTPTGRVGAEAGAGTADDEEMERRRTDDDEDAGVEFAAADADGGGKAADEGGEAGRVHLISQGGGGGMCAGPLMR